MSQNETKKELPENGVPVYQTYKDRVFRMLFSSKERLLELYNALNGTDYTNPDDLTVNTLENAIYINMKNDVSFIIDCNMWLYEHQSSYCPNMPLRGLMYFCDLYRKLLRGKDLSVRSLIRIPTPYYIVSTMDWKRGRRSLSRGFRMPLKMAKRAVLS